MVEMTQVLAVGDHITTIAIAPNPWESNGTPAQIRKIEGTGVEVIYGQYQDRAWVNIDSCAFVKHGELSELDKMEPNPFMF